MDDHITVDLHCNEDGVWTDEKPQKGRFARIKEGVKSKVTSAKEAVGGFVERNQEGIESGVVGSIIGFGMTAASILGLGAGFAILSALGGSNLSSEDGEAPSEDSSEGGVEE